MNLTIVICFFSPVEYELPKKHFLATLQMLEQYQTRFNFEVVVSQVLLPRQKGMIVPKSFFADYYRTDQVLFYKENLWNLATKRTENSNLIFFDADVYFQNDDWVSNCMDALQNFEIIQPFETCSWLSQRSTKFEGRKQAAAIPLSQGHNVNCKFHHVGFGWGCTRQAWQKIGGWFDQNVSGSNDTALALAMESEGHAKSWTRRWFERLGENSPAWHDYRENIQRENPTIGYAKENHLIHRWHGSNANRQYSSRHKLFIRKKNGNHPIHKNKNGLWQWDSPELNEGPLKYFQGRKDDES